MGTPKATTGIIYSGKLNYTLENKIQLDALKQILDIVLTEKIREKLGGTYGVHVATELEKTPEESFDIQLMFDTDPDRRVELVKAINGVISELGKVGPSTVNIQKAKEFSMKQHADDLKKNEYLLNVLNNQYRYKADFDKNYQKYVDQLSVNSIKEFAKKVFGQDNRIEVSLSSN